MNDHEKNEQATRDLNQQRANMGKGPGPGESNQQNHSPSGSGGGCFPRGTKIDTPIGKQDIANLKKGDYVLSFNADTGITCPEKILKFKSHANNKIWLIKFEDGSYIKTTAVHSFIIEGKWKKASNIKSGDLLISFDSSKGVINRTVQASSETEEVEEVYNLIVRGNYNFIADGAIAHSFTHFKSMKMAAWSILSSIAGVIKDNSLAHVMRNA